MKYLTVVFLTLLILVGCLPAPQAPTLAPESYGRQEFVNFCQKGFWDGSEITYKPIEGVDASSCKTYTLVTFKNTESKTSRISGLNLELNYECVTIDSIVTDDNIYERIRCSFDNSTQVLNIYLLGEDIRIITEITIDGTAVYFPPIGVGDEKL